MKPEVAGCDCGPGFHVNLKKKNKEKKKSIWFLQDRSLWKTVGGKGKTRGLFMASAGHFLIELGPQ